jgi:hypothetical protein
MLASGQQSAGPIGAKGVNPWASAASTLKAVRPRVCQQVTRLTVEAPAEPYRLTTQNTSAM